MERLSSMDIGSLNDSTFGDIVTDDLGLSFDEESPDSILYTSNKEGAVGNLAARLPGAPFRAAARARDSRE